NEYCSNATPSNPVAMWYTAATRSSTAFIDIVTGNDQFNGSTPFYSAGPGYDNASGLGLPIGTQIAAAMCPQRTWQFAGATQSLARTTAFATYGEQRDTMLNNAIRVPRSADLGARAATESTPVTLAIRNTPTANRDVQTVARELRAAGFTATVNGLLITATAPAATVNGYFRTAIHNVSQGPVGPRYANTAPITLPAAIAPYVGAVAADNLITRHRMSHIIR
ncbi:MAG TPA: protease pro-enzyme activation domain-containing protein, partial [Candidatus Aquilonibacter sp.]|nr:protease pro-enzyme activation domain-containing protein [Candidatus Aquilonibacter sp.]